MCVSLLTLDASTITSVIARWVVSGSNALPLFVGREGILMGRLFLLSLYSPLDTYLSEAGIVFGLYKAQCLHVIGIWYTFVEN